MRLINRFRNSSEKDKIVIKNVFGAFLVKGGGLIVSLFTLPIYMRFFADQQILGVWFTILSILSWILNFDLGIGNGLRNNLANALALNAKKEAKEYISSAYWMLGIFVIILFVIGNILLQYISWNEVFNVSSEIIPQKDMLNVVQYIFFGIILQFFLRLISAVLYAMQKSAVNNFIGLLSKIFELIMITIISPVSPIKNIKTLSFVYIFTSNIPLLITTLFVFILPLKYSRPNLRCFRKEKARDVLSLGSMFFFCQILYMLIANTNEFFISQYTNPSNVVAYQIYNRLFTLGSVVFMLALTPIWSAVSKAFAEKDYFWLRKLNYKLSKFAMLGILAEFLLIPFLQLIVNFWLKENTIQINYFYAISFSLFGSVMIYQSAVSTIANGIGRIKIQAISYALGVIVKVLIIHIGVALTNDWIVVVLANAFILIPYCIIQQVDMQKYLNMKIVALGKIENS